MDRLAADVEGGHSGGGQNGHDFFGRLPEILKEGGFSGSGLSVMKTWRSVASIHSSA
jgi:hypothetical protein